MSDYANDVIYFLNFAKYTCVKIQTSRVNFMGAKRFKKYRYSVPPYCNSTPAASACTYLNPLSDFTHKADFTCL